VGAEAGEIVYPGTCRGGLPPGRGPRAVRLRTDDELVAFTDAVQGRFAQRLESEVGDFVVRRADGMFAYQLAVVVDDAAQGVTHVVRGADLLDSTPRQIHLLRSLGLPLPRYTHVPVAVTPDGLKLSKQTGAPPLRDDHPVPSLAAAFGLLGQPLPSDAARLDKRAFWEWAREYWDPDCIPAVRQTELVEG